MLCGYKKGTFEGLLQSLTGSDGTGPAVTPGGTGRHDHSMSNKPYPILKKKGQFCKCEEKGSASRQLKASRL